MVDATDVQGYEHKYESQMAKLEEADIDDADRKAIREFVVHQRANTDNNKGTIVNDINQLRLSSERGRMPLTEMEKPDVDELTIILEDEHGLSERTVRNYRKSLRKFFIWHRGEEFGEQIKVGSPVKAEVDPDEALTDDEIRAMLDAAKNPRDKALIALLDDTGVRIGAALSFQMKHVNFQGQRATVTINEEANVKDDSGEKPITWSRGYIANWLDMHPRPDNPEAALFHKLRNWEDEPHAALAQQYAGRIIKDTAVEAGLDRDRVKAHLFRATAITRWILDEVSDQAIKHRTGWSKDSRQFETYSRVRDREMNDVIFDHYGIEGGDDAEEQVQKLENCPICRAPLRGDETFCPSCAGPINDKAHEVSHGTNAALREFLVDETNPDRREAASKAAEVLESDPRLAERLIDALEAATSE